MFYVANLNCIIAFILKLNFIFYIIELPFKILILTGSKGGKSLSFGCSSLWVASSFLVNKTEITLHPDDGIRIQKFYLSSSGYENNKEFDYFKKL